MHDEILEYLRLFETALDRVSLVFEEEKSAEEENLAQAAFRSRFCGF